MILAIVLLGISEAQAQDRYAFGPKAGQIIETEEDKAARYRDQTVVQLKVIQDQLKAAQATSQEQLDLLKQQNQLLTTLIQYQQQQMQMQQYQLQQQMQSYQQPGIAPMAPAQ